MLGPNALAYYVSPSVTEKKSFITLLPGHGVSQRDGPHLQRVGQQHLQEERPEGRGQQHHAFRLEQGGRTDTGGKSRKTVLNVIKTPGGVFTTLHFLPNLQTGPIS